MFLFPDASAKLIVTCVNALHGSYWLTLKLLATKKIMKKKNILSSYRPLRQKVGLMWDI